MSKEQTGRIIIEAGVNIWDHEMHIAKALANAGYLVRFIPLHNTVRSADAYVNNTIFEFKSPEGSTIKSVERNIVRALNHQSANIVITTFRMKKIQDRSVISFLSSQVKSGKGIKHLLFVTRDGKVIDINYKVR